MKVPEVKLVEGVVVEQGTGVVAVEGMEVGGALRN